MGRFFWTETRIGAETAVLRVAARRGAAWRQFDSHFPTGSRPPLAPPPTNRAAQTAQKRTSSPICLNPEMARTQAETPQSRINTVKRTP